MTDLTPLAAAKQEADRFAQLAFDKGGEFYQAYASAEVNAMDMVLEGRVEQGSVEFYQAILSSYYTEDQEVAAFFASHGIRF